MTKKPRKYKELKVCPPRLYVIGDIHGCLEETTTLVEHIVEDEGLRKKDMIIFVGDYIDRGPASKEVVDYLIEFKERYPSTVCLRGNHEDMLLDFLGFEGSTGDLYLPNGGEQTFESYKIDSTLDPEEIAGLIGEAHLDFYRSLERYVIVGDFVVVHAGLNPLRDLKMQSDHDLYWIRDEFIANKHFFDRTVIFGHTPYEDILFDQPYKIGIDTGLVYGNALTCIELVEGRVMQVESNSTEVTVSDFKSKGGEPISF